MPRHPKKYWEILASLWGLLIVITAIIAAITDINTTIFLYALFSFAPVAWLFHKLARENSGRLKNNFNQKYYEQAKAIVNDMGLVDIQTLCMSLEMEYADVCRLLDKMELEGFITPRRLKFPSI